MPTESRPGHVAIIAGFYEDVSAVTKGWKANPVNFDSVFNQSRHTWSFGSPDILPMFAHGASDPNKVDMVMYTAEEEDFAKGDASNLDTWVLDHFEALLKQSQTNSTLKDMLNQDKIVFFLHLLGLDTNGHGHRPFSQEYLDNIKLVDTIMEKIQKITADFFDNDQKTAFIFTADHGMDNRGSHGDGNPQNTETPLIAWGAGISPPAKQTLTEDSDPYAHWDCRAVQRKDVGQADIAPLMSSLIGVAYPMNSVGKLPINYLKNTDEYKALVSLGNAEQILQQFLVKEDLKRKSELLFEPFVKLLKHSSMVKDIQSQIAGGEYLQAEQNSGMLIELCRDGMQYYQRYDWLFLRAIVSAGYAGWIAYSSLHIIDMYVLPTSESQTQNNYYVF